MKKKEVSIEEAFVLLEESIGKLEDRDTTLEESFQTYQQGMELLKLCNEKVDKIEKKVLAMNEDGELYEF